VKNPPKTWKDLTKAEYNGGQIGQVIRAVRRHDLDAHHVRAPRCLAKVIGSRISAATNAAAVSLGRALSDALVRGEVTRRRPLALQHHLDEEEGRRRRSKSSFPPEGAPLNPSYASGITKTAARSERGATVPQLVPVRRGPDLHRSRNSAPHFAEERRRPIPKGFDPSKVKGLGAGEVDEYPEEYNANWTSEEWNKTYEIWHVRRRRLRHI